MLDTVLSPPPPQESSKNSLLKVTQALNDHCYCSCDLDMKLLDKHLNMGPFKTRVLDTPQVNKICPFLNVSSLLKCAHSFRL